MNKKLIGLALVGAITVNLTGCIIDARQGGYEHGSQSWEKKQKQNKLHISQLTLGMKKQQVLDVMGRPDLSEAYLVEKSADKLGHQVLVLFYRTKHKASDGETTKDECTPLVLKNGELVGWGETAYLHAKF
ncbi:MAG: DUF3192 domain-containing protein [Parashewanella sp.]